MRVNSVSDVMSEAGAGPVCVLLAGGRGSRLHELTERVCKPAVAFGPENRIVDFTLDNIRRSGLADVLVASQYCAPSLDSYLDRVWRPRFGTGLRVRRAATSARPDRTYNGTADAVWKNLAELEALNPRSVVVLSADHVYAMDYRPMIAAHEASGAAVTIAAHVVPAEEASAFGCIIAGADGRITDFVEKPEQPPTLEDQRGHSMVSMGIYVFDWAWLKSALAEDAAMTGSSHDFGHDILPRAVQAGQAQVYLALGVDTRPFYWRDVGTLDAYRATWLDCTGALSPCDLPFLAGSDLAAAGISGTEARLSGVRPIAEARSDQSRGLRNGSIAMPGARVSGSSRLRDVIVAPGARVPEGLVVGEDPEEDALWFRVTPGGTTLITAEMLARREMLRPRPLLLPNMPFHARSV